MLPLVFKSWPIDFAARNFQLRDRVCIFHGEGTAQISRKNIEIDSGCLDFGIDAVKVPSRAISVGPSIFNYGIKFFFVATALEGRTEPLMFCEAFNNDL